MPLLKIPHTNIEKDFLAHMALPGNSRILFSGPFGSGKTTFLHELVESNDSYVFLKLFPINYSVLQNDDVFELIKLDLILELMINFPVEIDLKVHEFPFLLTTQMFINERLNANNLLRIFGELLPTVQSGDENIQIMTAMASIAAKLNKSVVGLQKHYKEYKEEIGKAGGIKILQDFQKEQELRLRKSETDTVSGLIKDLIERVKLEKGRKESILVVDDLDRLDPEHIFRLFNIFSAHYDVDNVTNRFGFDKVIFVCDLENIRKIYSHRYGLGVDFSGYIHKFYSLIPFDFDNRKFIVEKVDQILSMLDFKPANGSESFRLQNQESPFYALCHSILISLINCRRLSIRRLTNYGEFTAQVYRFSMGKRKNLSSSEVTILVVFQFIKSIFGSWTSVGDELTILSQYYNDEGVGNLYQHSDIEPDWVTNLIITECLPFLIKRDGFSMTRAADQVSEFSEVLGHTIHFEKQNQSQRFLHSTRGNSGNAVINLNPFVVLKKTFDECLVRHILR